MFTMKKLTLALVLALCGARVYGQLPQEAAVNAEQIQALAAGIETAMKGTKSVEAVCEELGLPKEEGKSWFARHKVLTGAGCTYLTLLALSYFGQAAEYSEGKLTKDIASTVDGLKKGDAATRMIKVRNALSKLKFLQTPADMILAGSKTGFGHVNANRKAYILLVIAAIIAWEVYQGKDSAVVAAYNKLFGKKEVAPATSEVVAEEAAKAETPATTTTEVVAPTAA
jgi:hypothetical protein